MNNCKPNQRRFHNIVLALLISASCAAMLPPRASAQEATGGAAARPLTLSIDDAVSHAFKHNPMLAMSRADSRAALARVKMAASQRRPQLSATAFISNGDMGGNISGPSSVMPALQATFLPGRYYDRNLMLMWPLDFSGKISKSVSSAGRRADAAALDAEITRQDIALEVRMWYYETLYAEEREKIYERAHDAAVEQLNTDKAMVEAGKEPAYVLERAKAEAAMALLDHAEMIKDAVNARVNLLAMLGLTPDDQVELSSALAAPSLDSAPTVLPHDTPDLAAYRARAAAAKASRAAARRAFAPDVSLTLMADRISLADMEPMKGTAAAVVVAVPIGDGGMRRAAVSEASGMRDAADEELRAREIKLKADFRNARADFLTSLKNIDTAELALKSAEENFRVAKIRYEAGKSILVEMLDAREALTEARVMRLDAIRGALFAKDTLLRLAGKL